MTLAVTAMILQGSFVTETLGAESQENPDKSGSFEPFFYLSLGYNSKMDAY